MSMLSRQKKFHSGNLNLTAALMQFMNGSVKNERGQPPKGDDCENPVQPGDLNLLLKRIAREHREIIAILARYL